MYWNRLSDRLKETYGGKVYKLSLSSGCSCPNRDGTLGSRGCIFCDGAGAFAEAGDISAQLQAAKRRVAAKAGAHPRYIADIVSDVICDNRWIPGIVLRNSGFHFADQVSSNISCFGKNSAPNTGK